jgi:hypothetical protein
MRTKDQPQRQEAARFLTLACVIAIVWMCLSHVLLLWLAAAEDNPDMAASVPPMLTRACRIAFFPVRMDQVELPSSYSEAQVLVLTKMGIFANSLLWGFGSSFLFSLAAGLFKKKRRQTQEQAL